MKFQLRKNLVLLVLISFVSSINFVAIAKSPEQVINVIPIPISVEHCPELCGKINLIYSPIETTNISCKNKGIFRSNCCCIPKPEILLEQPPELLPPPKMDPVVPMGGNPVEVVDPANNKSCRPCIADALQKYAFIIQNNPNAAFLFKPVASCVSTLQKECGDRNYTKFDGTDKPCNSIAGQAEIVHHCQKISQCR